FLEERAKEFHRDARKKVVELRKKCGKLRKAKKQLLRGIEATDTPSSQPLKTEFEHNEAPTPATVQRPTLFRDIAYTSLGDLLSKARAAAERDLADVNALHQLRLSSKRLRYAMEIFAGCFSPSFKHDLYSKVEELQQLLGEVNDSHQIGQRLAFLQEELTKPAKPPEIPRQARIGGLGAL